ncbi:hypothetical protein Vadar_033392 [Vaccinium darrowii]|uniref:Uncharacterized protein n=1 Tax=Vaccinium darrowii TaxID=229202 RepID=A0ACB7Z0E5_9ERIC|nr:hypothetical protein Vadar_033392 [Vaccinium darrowii]
MVKVKGGFDKSSNKGGTSKEDEVNKSSKKGEVGKKGDVPEVLGKEFWFRALYLGGVENFWQAIREFRVVGKGPPNLLLRVPEAVVGGDELDPTVVYSSLRANVARDKGWVDVMLSRWCSITHTFLAAWGEFTSTLEDVCYLMGLNAIGEINLAFSGWVLYWYRDFGPIRKDDLKDEVPRVGFKKVWYLVAFLTLWLSHVFPDPPEVRGGLALAIDDESKFVVDRMWRIVEELFLLGYILRRPRPWRWVWGADKKSFLVVNLLTLGAMPFYLGGEFGVVIYNPLRVARQFGLDQGISAILASVDGQDAWSQYLKGEWGKDANVSQAVVTFPGKHRVGCCTASWRSFWKNNLATFYEFVESPPDSESVTVEVVDSKKSSDLCTASNVHRETWGYSKFLKDEILDLVDGFCDTGTHSKKKARKLPFANSSLAQIKRIFGNEADGLDVPTDDLNDVEMLSEGPNEGGFASNPSYRHGMGKQLRDIPMPSATEVFMDGENEESSEGDGSANDLSSESKESREEDKIEEERCGVVGKGTDVVLDGGLVVASKEVVCLEEIDSSSSQAGDLVPSALGRVGGASATPRRSTSEVVIDSTREKKDAEFIVVYQDDGSVELKKGCKSVTVKLKYFDGTVAHLEGVFQQVEEKLGKAKALVTSLEDDEAFCVEKLNAASG